MDTSWFLVLIIFNHAHTQVLWESVLTPSGMPYQFCQQLISEQKKHKHSPDELFQCAHRRY